MRARPCCTLLLAVAGTSAQAAVWQFAAGPTRSDGSAIEIARSTARWETALGIVSEQRVNVRTEQDTCYVSTEGPVCITDVSTTSRRVDGFGYLSVQRRFAFRRDYNLPVLGIGVVANTATNPYVSSPVAFSLSAGIRLGSRWSLEWRHFSNAGLEQPNLGQDILLLRGRFGHGSVQRPSHTATRPSSDEH